MTGNTIETHHAWSDNFGGSMIAIYVLIIILVIFLAYRFLINMASGSQTAVVTDIRPYMYKDHANDDKQGITLVYTLGKGKKGKVNLTETTFKERFPDLKIGDSVIKLRDESIPKKK